MLEIGSFIKMQRNKQKLTLGELAEGIVSVSYLSKIENLKTEPSPAIIEQLCKRLGIEMDRTMDGVIKEKCDAWFYMLLNKQDEKEIIATFKELEKLLNTNLSDVVLLYEIHKIRYYLYIRDTKSALDQIKRMSKITHSFETRELYFWCKFRGNYYSEIRDYPESLANYKKAEELSRKIEISEEELADLNYTLSVAYSQLRQLLEAIEYANLALDTFMKKYQFIRCAQCHIVLGISYRRIKMSNKAIENYNLAKHLAGLSNNQELIHLTNQNLGFLYATLGKYEKAKKFYLEIIESNDVSIEVRIIALTGLIKVYYQNEQMHEARQLIDEALKLLKKHPKGTAYEYYNYILQTYHYSINNQTNKFISLVKDKFLPFLQEQKDDVNLAIFATMLAKNYEEVHKYKEATKYYKLANQSYSELSTI